MWYSVFCSNESIYTVGKLNDLQSASCLDHRQWDTEEEQVHEVLQEEEPCQRCFAELRRSCG